MPAPLHPMRATQGACSNCGQTDDFAREGPVGDRSRKPMKPPAHDDEQVNYCEDTVASECPGLIF